MQVEKTYVVYRHIFPNGKSYIGITCAKPYTRRWTGGGMYRQQPKMSNAIKKYGWANVKHIVLLSGLSLNEANKLEREMITKYNTIENGYNVSPGGGSNKGLPHSAEARYKISIAGKGKKRPWAGANLRAFMENNGAWNKGRPLSPSHYQNLMPHWKRFCKPITAFDRHTMKPVLHFDSCEEASKFVGVSAENISRCARGRRPTSAGYIWRYDNENI